MSNVQIIHGDCMEYMATLPDKAFELAIVDPPYGIDMANGAHSNLKKLGNKDWDKHAPDEKYFNELFRVSKNQIIWGGNYFTLMPCRGFIFWDKSPMPPSYADGEYAWTSFNCNSKKWQGKTGNEVSVQFRIHPTQKPVALYQWLLKNYAKPGDKILDTHLGSGSSAIAADIMGFDFTGIEIDKDYYEAALDRFNRHKQQQIMEF
jgi:site-specific DNA-methyltransferase (adenine-specific)